MSIVNCFIISTEYRPVTDIYIRTIVRPTKSRPRSSRAYRQFFVNPVVPRLAVLKPADSSRCLRAYIIIPGGPIAFKSPRKNYKRVKFMTNLDDFDNEVVRRTVYSFYDNGQFLTSAKILVALREKIEYPGSKSSVKTILHNLNFKYRKCNDGRKFLLERNDIVACRVKFLRK